MNRMGRPPTGHQPRLSLRINPEALRIAKEQSHVMHTSMGRWIEEAINEKLEREKGIGNVT